MGVVVEQACWAFCAVLFLQILASPAFGYRFSHYDFPSHIHCSKSDGYRLERLAMLNSSIHLCVFWKVYSRYLQPNMRNK